MAKVKLELRSKNTLSLLDFAKTVLAKMNGNVNFANPNPQLGFVQGVVNSVSTALTDVEVARKTLETKIEALTPLETQLESLLTQLGSYVENTSGGDASKIKSAGMDVRNDASAPTVPDKVIHVNATLGDNAGEIDLSWDSISNAKSYVVQTAITGETPLNWAHATVATKSKAELLNLKTGVSYEIRVAAIGSVGQGPWSDAVTKVAP